MPSTYSISINRLLFWICGIIALAIIILLPIASLDVINSVDLNDAEDYFLTPKNASLNEKEHTRIEINFSSLNELGQSVSIKVSGHRSCNKGCDDHSDNLIVYSASKKDTSNESLPIGETIALPNGTGDFTKDFSFPVDGKFVTYPFDTYKIGIGIVVERTLSDKSIHILTPSELANEYSIRMNESLLKMEVSLFESISPINVKPKLASFDYTYAGIFELQRPLFIKIIDASIMVLVTFLSLYTVLFMPFEPVVVNGGTVIFGLYGARTLILGGYPSDTTLIDAIFLIVISLNILVLLVKAVFKFYVDGKMTLLK